MSPESMSQRELKIESANIGSLGSSMNHMRPYNHTARYGCEYYFLHAEIPNDELCHNYSQFMISHNSKPNLSKRENLLTRVKRSFAFFKTKDTNGSGNDPDPFKNTGDGSGGGKAVGGSYGGASSGGEGGGDGGGSRATNANSDKYTIQGFSLDFNSDSILQNMNENRDGIIINGGDMGGGGLKDNSIA